MASHCGQPFRGIVALFLLSVLGTVRIPYTLNGKMVELAVQKVIHNDPVLDRDALANPDVLDLYMDLPEL
jgi:acetoacetyl-CoA synthetase